MNKERREELKNFQTNHPTGYLVVISFLDMTQYTFIFTFFVRT